MHSALCSQYTQPLVGGDFILVLLGDILSDVRETAAGYDMDRFRRFHHIPVIRGILSFGQCPFPHLMLPLGKGTSNI